MSKYGIRVAQPTKSTTSNLSTDLVFTTEFLSLPVIKEGLLEINQTEGITSKTLKHGLDFVPIVIAFSESSEYVGKWFNAPYIGANSLTANTTVVSGLRIDKENVKFSFGFGNGVGGEILSIKYFICDLPLTLSM